MYRPVIRIKAPRDGETIIEDHVQGRVAFPNKDLDDFVILRSDGTPTYMHAVVVDDHDMGITHVIRGDDHLTNAARQSDHLRRDGLAGAGVGAYPADPRAGRRKAFEAPWRARRRGLSRHGLPAGGAPQLPRAARLVAWRRRDLLQRAGGRMVRRSTAIGKRRERASISPSCRASTATTSASPTTQTLLGSARSDPAGDRGRRRLSPPRSTRGAAAQHSCSSCPGLKERAKTLLELSQRSAFLFVERPLPMEARPRPCSIATARDSARPPRRRDRRHPDWTTEPLEAAVRAFADSARRQAGHGGAAAPRRAHRQRLLAADFRRARGTRTGRKSGTAGGPGDQYDGVTGATAGLLALQCEKRYLEATFLGLRQARSDQRSAALCRRDSATRQQGFATHGSDDATLTIGNESWEFPVRDGTVGPSVIDISRALRRDRSIHLRPGLHVDGVLRVRHHLSSTATRASSSTRLSDRRNSPSTATSSRPATCFSTASCRRRRRRTTSTTA